MIKQDVMGGSVSLIRKGEMGKKGAARADLLIVNGGINPVFIDASVWKALTAAMRENKEIGDVVAGWLK